MLTVQENVSSEEEEASVIEQDREGENHELEVNRIQRNKASMGRQRKRRAGN